MSYTHHPFRPTLWQRLRRLFNRACDFMWYSPSFFAWVAASCWAVAAVIGALGLHQGITAGTIPKPTFWEAATIFFIFVVRR
jgi:hypothetical protein